ncbi:hypothetical protein Plhal304r1_c050g0132351 [Plasmopara halstedii]
MLRKKVMISEVEIHINRIQRHVQDHLVFSLNVQPSESGGAIMAVDLHRRRVNEGGYILQSRTGCTTMRSKEPR